MGLGGVCGVGGVRRFGLLWAVRVLPRGWETNSLGLRQAQSGSGGWLVAGSGGVGVRRGPIGWVGSAGRALRGAPG